jgi:DNA-binding transcriptional ArsR family regulator
MLDITLSALADPTRRAIIGLLAEEELSVGEVVDHFEITQSAITRHLNVLEQAQLIHRRREGQKRICVLSAQPLSELDDWVGQYRTHWKGSLGRLNKTVSKLKKK